MADDRRAYAIVACSKLFSAMYCPVCGAEYRPGFSICSDCQVALVPEPPRRRSSTGVEADSDSFVAVWAGDDPLKHAEISEALDRKEIPARTLRREERSFHLVTQPAFEIYVPDYLANSALEAVKDLAAAEEAAARFSDSGDSEFPDDGSLCQEDEGDEQREDALDLDPLDATVQIWSGDDIDTAAMIVSSLREHRIVCRSEPDLAELKKSLQDQDIDEIAVFVFPVQARHAKAIVREIIDALE